MKIAIACDHGALDLKNAAIKHLTEKGHTVVNFGTDTLDSCDYPDFVAPAAKAVACGGCFRPNQKKSEAKVIADYLVEQGISADRIILEDRSTTTFENFEFARRLIENHAVRDIDDVSVAFLSSSYHIFRASKIAELCGYRGCGKVSCPTPGSAWQRYVREYIVAYELFYNTIKKKLG